MRHVLFRRHEHQGLLRRLCRAGGHHGLRVDTGPDPLGLDESAAWGLHTSSTVDPKQLYVISIVVDKGADFDLWIDEVAFYK